MQYETHVDESYLQIVCEHLADNRPRLGAWQHIARRWNRRPDSMMSRTQLLGFSRGDLHRCAAAAALPLPLPVGEPSLEAVQDNCLAVVLAAAAELGVHEGCHRPTGQSVGDVLRRTTTAEDPSRRYIVEGVADANPGAFVSLMRHLQGPHGCDLRTLAALAYRSPTSVDRYTALLLTTHAGAWPGSGVEQWNPVDEFAMDVYTPKARQRYNAASASAE
ncbi:hypothetical protein GCM10010326_00570 [Streptomyces xanthochromogenes]|uniref:Uncharacterized protein n=1 Tax=Streptomyces xanthochromogenes TaxID=67384 RepID=A0ABQ2ZG84_9ACTN|nr:hypothetical protein GCM10010326_00570 [Streptomyces xanthochromogenes]